jgi:hypothetical protein
MKRGRSYIPGNSDRLAGGRHNAFLCAVELVTGIAHLFGTQVAPIRFGREVGRPYPSQIKEKIHA